MYDFSTWLEQSLQKLTDEKSQPSESSLEVAIGLDSISAELKSLLHRYRINRAAGIRHGGTAQRGMLWGLWQKRQSRTSSPGRGRSSAPIATPSGSGYDA